MNCTQPYCIVFLTVIVCVSGFGQDYSSIRTIENVGVGNDVDYYDGSYYFLGNTTAFGQGSRDVVIAKLDSAFEPIWTKTYGGGSEDFCEELLVTDDGGVIVVGYSYSFGSSVRSGYIQKVNGQGDLEWSNGYLGSAVTILSKIEKRTASTYVFSGFAFSPITNRNRVIGIINDDGELLQSFEFDCDSLSQIGQGFAQTKDGGYILAGAVFAGDGFGGSDLSVIKVSSTWEVEWAKRIGGSGTEVIGESAAGQVLPLEDGYFIVTMTDKTDQASFDAYDLLFLKLDLDGDTVWTRTYGTEFNDIVNVGALSRMGPNRITFGMLTQRNSIVDYEERIIEMDTMGNITSMRGFNLPGGEALHRISLTKNNHWMWAGNTRAYNADGDPEACLLVLPDEGDLCLSNPLFTTFTEVVDFKPFVKDQTCESYVSNKGYFASDPIAQEFEMAVNVNCLADLPPMLLAVGDEQDTSSSSTVCLTDSIELRTLNGEGTIWWTLAEDVDNEVLEFGNSFVFTTESFEPKTIVAHDEWGREAAFEIATEECRPVIIYELITPNNDGSNDVFFVDQLPEVFEMELIVFTTWGEVVYTDKDYDNAWSGGELSSGNYFYALKVNGNTYKGPLVIQR